MTAEIVSEGTELLLGQITDTNAQHLGKLLPELGAPPRVADGCEPLAGERVGTMAVPAFPKV